MGHPIITALLLIGAGLLTFRLRDWTHRWMGILLVSAGINIAAGVCEAVKNYAFIAWLVLPGVLCVVAIFKEPRKNSPSKSPSKS